MRIAHILKLTAPEKDFLKDVLEEVWDNNRLTGSEEANEQVQKAEQILRKLKT